MINPMLVGFANVDSPINAAATVSERGASSQRVRHDMAGAIGAGPATSL